MNLKVICGTVALTMTSISLALAEGETKNWDFPTGFGVAVRDAAVTDDITLDAWCLVSTGSTGRVSENVVGHIPASPGWLKRIVRNTFARKGNVVCFGRAAPKSDEYDQLLSFSAAWWEDGSLTNSDKHSCRINKTQCVNRWGDRREPKTTEGTNGLSVCIEVTADKGSGETLQSVTMSAGENLPETISQANGMFSDLSCDERISEWK